MRDYVPLGELEVGTVLHVQGGGEAILVSTTWRQGDFEVFDFEVEGLHNFYVRGEGSDAAGVLVHNSTPKPTAIGKQADLQAMPAGAADTLNDPDWSPEMQADFVQGLKDAGEPVTVASEPATDLTGTFKDELVELVEDGWEYTIGSDDVPGGVGTLTPPK